MAEGEAKTVEEARKRLRGIAVGLTVRFGLDTASALLANNLVSLLIPNAGRNKTIEFLQGVVDDVANDHPENSMPEREEPA